MNEMWSEMTDHAREEYKDYFIRYHNSVAKTGITGKRIKPATVLPQNVVSVFEKAILTKVMISAKKVSHVIKFRKSKFIITNLKIVYCINQLYFETFNYIGDL